MPDVRLYNTMSQSVEPFAPADGAVVRMYTCGPTVYNPAHVGNFRTFLFEDLMRRVLRLAGWGVDQVMNLTDVDDKIIRRASEAGVTIGEITGPVTEQFHADRRYLRIQDAERYPRATESIPEMIELVQRLIQHSAAYQAEDGSVYFAIDRFPEYGRLSRLDTREIQSGARVAQDDYAKENAQDFALWKAAKPEDEASGAAWDSPWGRGRPGWHLECSAMAMRFLGETLDIHCGGIDLIFPHHEDEIAQSEAATGREFSRFWCHGQFLLTDGAKMAKRVGNVATVQDMRDQGVSGAAFRHFAFSTHYRKQLNLSPDALEASTEGVRRVGDFVDRLAVAAAGTPGLARAAAVLVRDATEALFDDLNAPGALAALYNFIRTANGELDRAELAVGGGGDAAGDAVGDADRTASLQQAREAFALVNSVLDIVPERAGGDDDGDLAAYVEGRLAERRAARARRDFAAADGIRAELTDRGIAIEDGPQGTRWKKIQ
ncbi:MAG: cysteine--tRNA ligase [Gemmatimonadaceae bacterium]